MAVVRRTSVALSDGRELIYFDESDDAVRVLVDPRPLTPAAPSSTIRYDAVLGEWIALAGHRQDRTYLPPTDECPLCPSAGGRQTEIPSPGYDVVVFENRFPSFAMQPGDGGNVAPDGHAAPGQPAAQGGDVAQGGLSAPGGPAAQGAPPAQDEQDAPPDPPFLERPAYGRCEVVSFTAEHNSSFSALTPARVGTVMEAWVDRTRALSRLPHIEQVFCFENRGREIGVTLSHPHGQIYGYPFVTPRTRRMLESARHHRERTWRNLFADVLAAERRSGERVVARTEHWTAFVPFAARWPMEVHLYPNRQVADLTGLSGAERDEFAELYLEVLRRMEAVHDDTLPYIAAWHQAPVRIDRDLAYLHLQVFSFRRAKGKLKYLAGSESAMDAYINDVSPEHAAQLLREARP